MYKIKKPFIRQGRKVRGTTLIEQNILLHLKQITALTVALYSKSFKGSLRSEFHLHHL